MASPTTLSAFLLLSSFLLHHAGAELVLEEGYTVTTPINGHKLKINPFSVLPIPGSTRFIVLDSSTSSFFTLSLQEDGVVERLAGDGSGFEDGELGLARFNRPRSFAVDGKGNVYVADKANHAIRKITNSGGVMDRVVTIAGGYSTSQLGHRDGPAQNATFSSDFDLVFVPEMCALLVSDHGNQLVRQINLKPKDCATGSQQALGATPLLAMAVGLSCLIGIVIGVAVRSYVIPREGLRRANFSTTWKHRLMNWAKQVTQMHCFGIRNAVANSSFYALLRRIPQLLWSHIFLMLTLQVNNVSPQSANNALVSLLDSDVNSSSVEKPQMYVDQLNELLDFGGNLQLLNTSKETIPEKEDDTSSGNLPDNRGSIENMILANVEGFRLAAGGAAEPDESTRSGLVKRRGNGKN